MGKGLEGIKVLELGGGISAAMAGKLMADLGAEVVKLEPPGGEAARLRGPFAGGEPNPEASGEYLFLNANKRSVEADLAEESGQGILEKLAARADILIHNFRHKQMAALALDFEHLAALNPRLVMLSITPFGLSGPYRDYAAADLNLIHSGGWGWNCPGPGTDPRLPPIKPFGRHALIQAGIHGAMAAMAAHYAARNSGQGEHIDLSAQEVVVNMLGRHFVNYTYARWLDSRVGEPRLAPNGFFQCSDGVIYLVIVEEDQWARLLELMGETEWGMQEKFQGQDARCAHVGEVHDKLNPWLATWKVQELFEACQQRRICACLVATFDQIRGDEHLKERGYCQTQQHPETGELWLPGAPYLLQNKWWALRSPAPRLGEANGDLDSLLTAPGTALCAPAAVSAPAASAPAASASVTPAAPAASASVTLSAPAALSAPAVVAADALPISSPLVSSLPLAGVRILDFTWYWAGPYGTVMLGHLGAEVIKIESPNRPDLMRRFSNTAHDMEPGLNRAGSFNQLGQNKKSFAVDLSLPEGKALVKRLAAQCDVVTSNFSTGVMDRLGLGAEVLHGIKPELIVAALSGFGQTGPKKNYIGYGQAIVPLAGISAQTGYSGGGAEEIAIAYGDPNAGAYMAYGVVAALAARQRHGGGQFIDLSIWEAMMASAHEGWMNHTLGNPPHQPMGNHDLQWAPHNCYRCSGEDDWISIAVVNEEQWAALCGEMGQPGLAGDPRFADAARRKNHEDALDETIGLWCADQDKWKITQRLQQVGVAAFPSLSTKEVDEDPHLNAREFFGRVPHPEVGVRSHAGIPWRLTRRPNGVRLPAPLMGQHTDEILRQVLEMPEDEIGRLRQTGVIA